MVENLKVMMYNSFRSVCFIRINLPAFHQATPQPSSLMVTRRKLRTKELTATTTGMTHRYNVY